MNRKTTGIGRWPALAAALFAGLIPFACTDSGTGPTSGSGPDFNPLPQAADYVYRKVYSTGIMGISFACTTTVRRSPLPDSSRAAIHFLDRNSFRSVMTYSHADGNDSIVRDSGSFLDTVAYSESGDQLALAGADRFLYELFPPTGTDTAGLRWDTELFPGATVRFPKRRFSLNPVPPGTGDTPGNCAYVAGTDSLPCRRQSVSDLRYRSEEAVFLPGVGLLRITANQAWPPLGSGGGRGYSMQLLYRVQGGDTTRFDGKVRVRM